MLTKEQTLAYYKKFRDDIYSFAQFFFPHLLKEKTPEFHKEIYSLLSTTKFLAIEAFRGAAKSTLGLIIYPIHYSLFKRTGDITLISMSERFILNEVMRKIKSEFENNEKLRAFWGDLTTDKWSETFFTLKTGISFEGCGIGGQLRGGRRGLIALDDLEDEESVLSEEQRDKLKRRIHKELIPKLVKDGQMIYMGTPVHALCHLKQIIDTPDNGWEKRIYSVYKTEEQKEGNEQWPEMFSHLRLKQIKATIGSSAFSTEFLCNPIGDENAPIKESMLRYWTELPQQYSAVIAVDPAYSEDVTADYKAASLIAVDTNSNRYLLDYIRTHDKTGQYINAILNMYLRNKNIITGVGLPMGAGDKEFFNSFMDMCEERKLFPPIIELKNTFTTATGETKRNKKSRIIAALQPLFERGKYYIHPSHVEARDEILTIGQSRWDDLTDTMAYAEQILQPVYYPQQQEEENFGYEPVIENSSYGL